MIGARIRWCGRCGKWYGAREDSVRACTLCGAVQLEYRCYRCGHVWSPKKDFPKTCPECGSPYWDRARVKTDEKM